MDMTSSPDELDRTLTNDEFEALAKQRSEPLSKVPASFPSMHSRYPAVVSRGADASRVSLRPDLVVERHEMSQELAARYRAQLREALRPLPVLDYEP